MDTHFSSGVIFLPQTVSAAAYFAPDGPFSGPRFSSIFKSLFYVNLKSNNIHGKTRYFNPPEAVDGRETAFPNRKSAQKTKNESWSGFGWTWQGAAPFAF